MKCLLPRFIPHTKRGGEEEEEKELVVCSTVLEIKIKVIGGVRRGDAGVVKDSFLKRRRR